MTSKTAGTHIRLPAEVEAKLRDEAAARMVSVSFLAGRLIADGLERLVPVPELLAARAEEAT